MPPPYWSLTVLPTGERGSGPCIVHERIGSSASAHLESGRPCTQTPCAGLSRWHWQMQLHSICELAVFEQEEVVLRSYLLSTRMPARIVQIAPLETLGADRTCRLATVASVKSEMISMCVNGVMKAAKARNSRRVARGTADGKAGKARLSEARVQPALSLRRHIYGPTASASLISSAVVVTSTATHRLLRLRSITSSMSLADWLAAQANACFWNVLGHA